MAAADYRLMTEATGQRIAAALEALSGFGAYLTTADVVNNLTSTATDKPLAAAQGKALNDNLAHAMGVDIPLVSNPVQLAPGSVQVFSSNNFSNYKYVDLYFAIQGSQTAAMRICPNYAERRYKLGFLAWNDADNVLRRVVLNFTTAGRYFTDIVVKMSYGSAAFADNSQIIWLTKAEGYAL